MFAGWLESLLRTMQHQRYGHLQRYNEPAFHDVHVYLVRDDAVPSRQLARIRGSRRLHLNSGVTSESIAAGFGRASRHIRQYQSRC
jgi:hypothetical protein